MSVISPYAPIDALPAYQAGRSAEAVAQQHGLAEAFKLASNESPYGPLPSVAEAIAEATTTINRYPHVSALPLRQALGAVHGVDVDQVVVGVGSSGVLFQLATAYVAPDDEIVMHVPAFEAYPIIATMSHARAVQVPLTDWTTDVERLAAAVTPRTKAVFLTDPHNPTGTTIPSEAVRWLAEELADRCLLVVDHAYIDYDPDQTDDLSSLVDERPDVVLLRTFSKAHGLAALRVGYAVASHPVATAMQRVAAPFAVNGVALVAAQASLRAEAELAERVQLVVGERDRISRALAEAGTPVPDSRANFVFIPTPRAAEVVTALEQRGLATRAIGQEGVRVTVSVPEENDRFLETWSECGVDLTAVRRPDRE